jgi:hypothetical protein
MDGRTVVGLIRLVLVLVAVALAAFPLLVILDLAQGGSGYGLCPGGVGNCRNPYTAAPELSLALTVGLLFVLGGFRLTTRLSHRLDRRPVPPTSQR